MRCSLGRGKSGGTDRRGRGFLVGGGKLTMSASEKERDLISREFGWREFGFFPSFRSLCSGSIIMVLPPPWWRGIEEASVVFPPTPKPLRCDVDVGGCHGKGGCGASTRIHPKWFPTKQCFFRFLAFQFENVSSHQTRHEARTMKHFFFF